MLSIEPRRDRGSQEELQCRDGLSHHEEAQRATLHTVGRVCTERQSRFEQRKGKHSLPLAADFKNLFRASTFTRSKYEIAFHGRGKCSSRSNYLRSVGVGSRIRHGKHERLVVLCHEFLVFELRTINGLTASAIATGEVSTLHMAKASGLNVDQEGRPSRLQDNRMFNAPGA
jgi:hypothetical protein